MTQNADSMGHCRAVLHDEANEVTHWCYLEDGHNWVHECHECDTKWKAHNGRSGPTEINSWPGMER